MPITKIQLRGISRVPSDRLTKDGDCAESVNVILRETETTPMAPPSKVSNTLAPGLSTSGISVAYIHKTNTYTNYVGTKAYTENNTSVMYLVAYIYNPTSEQWSTYQIHKIGSDSVVSITSIGNMLVYSLSDGKTYYALCKNLSYMLLGDSLPRPSVDFTVTPQADFTERWYMPVTDLYNAAVASYPGTQVDASLFWQFVMQTRSGAGEYQNTDSDTFYNNLMSAYWDECVTAKRRAKRESKYFTAPVLVRCALRMRDGSFVNVSEPIILTGAAKNQFVEKLLVNIGTVDSSGQGILHYFIFEWLLSNIFSVSASVHFNNASDWQDLISSVDIFVSTDVLSPALNTGFDATAETQETTMTDSVLTMEGYDAKIGFDIEDETDDLEEKLLEKGNFYLLKSFPITELPAEYVQLRPVSQDDLLVSERLADPQPHTIGGHGKLGSYNNRLVTREQHVRLSPGHGAPQAVVPLSGLPTKNYEIVYFVRDDNGNTKIVHGYSMPYYPGSVLGFVSYPDARCYKADLYVSTQSTTTVYTLPMREHPKLDVAYGFWGLDDVLDSAGDGREEIEFQHVIPRPAEDPAYLARNRFAMSEMDNPFVFPIGQMQRFSERITGVTPVTIALSTGQFGQFPLYVFTEGGIWVIPIDSEGKMAAARPVSRDVAIEDTIAQLDQAIVFVSKQGVMLLQGSKVSCLSQIMNGKNFVPSSGLISAIESYSAASLIVDQVPFMTFVKGSVPAYDYAGQRIIFFNPTYPTFQYVFSLGSQTWHRIKPSWAAPTSFRVLNSFPNCLVFFGAQSGGDIVDFSTYLDADSDTTALPGLVVTRDLNFGDNDAYKTIKRIKIRGDRFPETNPWKYVLLGSNDRKNYHVLHSLRGPSWKYYRVAIITTMKLAGRISYIELEWEPRFSDRIR